MRRLLTPSVPLLLALSLVLAACGDDSSGDDTTAATDTTGVPGSLEAAGDGEILDDITVTGDVGEAPTVDFDAPLTVDDTVRRILVEGDGDPTESGMSISFEHVAINGRDANEFDNSYQAGPATAVLDETQVIPGLIKGLLDVPVGSRVLVAMSPDDSFGPRGGIAEAGVEADDSIVFVVDLHSATFPLERAEGTPVEPEPGLPTVTLADDGTPTVEIPDGDPPSELVIQPLIEGEGPEVEQGQTITAHYTGLNWRTGEPFDSSWDRSEPSDFPIGVGGVIEAWDQGLVGQPVGSQVLLVVPPELGYGAEGNDAIGVTGDDTMVFVVDILAAA